MFSTVKLGFSRCTLRKNGIQETTGPFNTWTIVQYRSQNTLRRTHRVLFIEGEYMKVNISATEVLFPRRNVNRSRKNLLVWWVSGLIENKKIQDKCWFKTVLALDFHRFQRKKMSFIRNNDCPLWVGFTY